MDNRLQRHPFHLVTPSPWPLFASLAALLLTLGAVMYMHNYFLGGYILFLAFLYLLGIVTLWWRDVIREATFQGKHTAKVQHNLKFGFALFIFSEVMFFFGFFWAFFHSSLSPGIEIGAIWPPANIMVPYTWGIPLFNTIVLLTSGVSITYAHHKLIKGDHNAVIYGFGETVLLAVIFLAAQVIEFIYAPFDISDSVYGSAFFMLSGFHGAHVIVGTLFLIVCFIRCFLAHFEKEHHVGFEAAVWYWHFVDVVWLFLFIFVYYWSGYATLTGWIPKLW